RSGPRSDLLSVPTRRSSDLVHGHIGIFLSPLFSSPVPDRDHQGMPPLVGGNITSVPIGLFLEIVLGLPDHFFLGNDRKSGNVWKDRKSTRLNSSHVKISYAV